MRSSVHAITTPKLAVSSLGLAALLLVSTTGSAPAACARYEYRTYYRQVCLRRSNTGHCAHYGSRSSTRRVCVQYTRARPPSSPSGTRNYMIGKWCDDKGKLAVVFTRHIMSYHLSSRGPLAYRVIGWDVMTATAVTMRFQSRGGTRIAGYRYVLTNNANNVQITQWLNPRTNRWQHQMGSVYKRC